LISQKNLSPAKSPKSVLTPERVIEHEHDHVQNLLVTGAPTSQTGMRRQLDSYAASTACTREPLPRRFPIREEVPWVDLALAGQLDLPPSATGIRGDKKLGFEKEN
jgi:hypothetical protein